LRQQRASMRMQELQPQIQAIQKKYKDNPQKMQEEFQKIGYNPAETLTGCLPLLIQFPILIGLFQVIGLVLGTTPQALFELSRRVYPWLGIDLAELLPISNTFLWMNLGQPDPYFVLPVLVFITMFVSQKYLTPTAQKKNGDKKNKQDDPTAAMTQSMQYTMPIMFGFFSLQFQAGLSIYFILSNLLSIAQGLYMRQSAPTVPIKPISVEAIPSEVAREEKEVKPVAVAKNSSSNQQKRSAKQSTTRKRRSAKR
jgi:YidC/Oxa1 family membrane protein insertase